MALKDINKGFGDLPSWLVNWHCGSCGKNSPIAKWQIVTVQDGANTLDGRACPDCGWQASQVGHTRQMLEADKHAMKVITDREPKKQKDNKKQKKTL